MRIYKICLFMLLAFSAWANRPTAVSVELNKNITRVFDAPAGKTIAAINRYGKIKVLTYAGQQVKYEINIISRAFTQSKAQKELDRVNIVFKDSQGLVSATTEIEDKTSWFTWSWAGNAELDINYTIYVPDGRKLNLNQKYGNILMPVYNGPCTLETAYGNIEASDINAPYEVTISYGNGRFGCIKNGTIDLKYSDFTASSMEAATVVIKYGKMIIENAHQVNIDSKYSNFNIGSCNFMTFSGKYDHMILKNCGKLSYENKYGELELGILSGNASITGSYHSTGIKEIRPGVGSIAIKGSYSNVNIQSSGGYQYTVEGQYTSVKRPGNSSNGEEDDNEIVKGSKKGSGPVISIVGSYNSVVLK